MAEFKPPLKETSSFFEKNRFKRGFKRKKDLSKHHRAARKRMSGLLSHWFGVGLIPIMPGTWGSAAALPFVWAMTHYGSAWVLWCSIVILSALGIWAAGRYALAIETDDPSEVVIDEVAGQWITFALVPPVTLELLLIGFLLFRVFDIWKPWPVRWADRHIHGGLGIMLDDILAGVYACLGLYLVTLF